MDLTPEQLYSGDVGYWATENKIKLQSGIYSFKNHEYQLDVMSGNPLTSPKVTVDMKATQGGFTEIYVLKSLHGMIFGHYPSGVLYLFPTNDDVNDFSKSRFKPLIQANRNAIGKYVKDTDTAALKKVRDAFLYLRGARLSQAIEGDHKESTKLRSIPVDCVNYDEFDLMEEDVQAKAQGRMGHSMVQEEHFLSNPTIPDFGIDAKFQESDQRHWHRKCLSCREFTSAELEFPACVKIRQDGTGYIGCKKCGSQLGIYPGEWVAAYPGRKIVGRRWSKLTSIFHDPADILEKFTNPPRGNLGDVYRLDLGLAYVSAEEKLKKSDVYACCGQYIPLPRHDGPCAMGVDVSPRHKHVIIGARTGKEKYEIFKTEIVKGQGFDSWCRIHDLVETFNVKSAVIDLRPCEDAAREFRKKESCRMYLSEYSETSPLEPQYNDNSGIVKVNRTEIFDATHRMVTIPGMLTIPRISPEIDEFAKQLCNVAKKLEENKKTKLAVYRYIKVGDKQDHFRNALNYFLLAANPKKVGVVERIRRFRKRQLVANNNYQRM